MIIMKTYYFAAPQFKCLCLDPRQKHAGMTALGLSFLELYRSPPHKKYSSFKIYPAE